MSASRLHDATSPYLQQHADNPVDWWPWCDEALALARAEGRPILLSIGYSACHWCHVMAHESFEDPATAADMNALFVNIKVDREERPDLDRIYQTAHQLLAQRPGGWPLTVFLSPHDLSPFFAGTYFPPQPRHGLPAFRELLRMIDKAYREQGDAIEQQNGSLRQALARLDGGAAASADSLDDTPLHEVRGQLAQQFDATHGGFGDAPKFPHPGTLRFLLREAVRNGDEHAGDMALQTLQRIADGGINDHLGGGFCRYAVDAEWMIPHFEKMLYDNGQLLALFAEAWQADAHRPLFKHACERTAEWVMRDMQSPLGGYYASLDADSEGEEGRYYVWTPAEVVALLEDDEWRVFAPRFGLDRAANFEGRWHLHTFVDTATIAERSGLAVGEVRRLLRSARERLLAVRQQRVPPARDDKILTSWNALMIKGMARAGRLLERADWIDSAARALAYLRETHWHDGRLLATSRDGKAQLNAYLDDHAYLIDAILELLQARWDSDALAFAETLAERLLAHFEDPAHGGFFFTSDDHEQVVHRPRPFSDDATPSGNAVAVEALLTLAQLTGDLRWHSAAERVLRAAWGSLAGAPYAHVGLIEGLRQYLEPPEHLVIRGDRAGCDTWQAALRARYAPGATAFAVPVDAAGLPAALSAKPGQAEETLAYRCRGTTCEPPLRDPAALLDG